jgi:tetratricopeptide (TPR) repeat protein
MTIELTSIRENGKSAKWLEENAQDLYDTLRFDVKHESRLKQVIDAMLALIPNMTRREDLRRWGKLLEQVYDRTELALNNGLNEAGNPFIMIKRAKKPQLPTITNRDKRLLVHPTQLFEMYLILFMKYSSMADVDRQGIRDILKFANEVGDVYCVNKAHQAIAYIYNNQRKFELAIPHANTSYAYFSAENNHLDAGISSFALGVSYHQLGALTQQQQDLPFEEVDDYATAEYWYTRSADHYVKTSYRHQYAIVSFSTTALKYSADKWDEVLTWAEITYREAQQANLRDYIGLALSFKGLAKGQMKQYEAALSDLEEALAIFKANESINSILDVNYHIAYVHAINGKFRLARQQMATLQKLLIKYYGSFQEEAPLDFDSKTYRWDSMIMSLQKAMESDGELGLLFLDVE